MKRTHILSTLLVVGIAIILPFGIACLIGGRDYVFIGFLLNPGDGASYLAKMQEGWAGSWQFYLPFTYQPGEGTYLFLYYLFLGHLARWLGLSLILTYHIARIIGAGLLLFALAGFYDILFAGRPDLYKMAFWLTTLGAGMGWTVILTGAMPSDFWIAEAYPFLSMYANPHFPLGLALLVSSFSLLLQAQAKWRYARLLINGLLISVIFPFALVIALVVSGAWCLWTLWEKRHFYWQPVVCLGLLGGPMLIYEFWISQAHPVLAVWDAQNLTSSPPVWDLVLSFSPALILAFVGVYALVKQPRTSSAPILFAWLGLSLLLIYFPFSLQRRFMLGLYIPVAALAIFGLDYLRHGLPRLSKWLVPVTFGLSLPSTLLLILIGVTGALSHSSMLYLSQDEAQALAWIKAKTPVQSVVLASPEMGRWIPAETGRRVIYGHPYETPYASQAEARVRAFFQQNGAVDPHQELLESSGVDYLMYGPRERAVGGNLDLSRLSVVFNSKTVQVYQVKGMP